MEDIKELNKEDFAMVLLFIALFHTEETEKMFKKYATQNTESCYNDTKE